MLSRRLRLSRDAFTDTRRHTRATSEHFSLVFGIGTPESKGCSVVVSKKVAKSSVARHFLKRRILSVLRPWCTDTGLIIVYARPGSEMISFPALSDELTALLTRSIRNH